MKKITYNLISFLLLTNFIACSSKVDVAPSNNKSLSSISPTKERTNGYLQKSMDEWLKDDWMPTISNNEEIQQKYMKKVEVVKNSDTGEKEIIYVEKEDRPFTLQEYVDKASAYMETSQKNNLSNVEKLNKLPVIGR